MDLLSLFTHQWHTFVSTRWRPAQWGRHVVQDHGPLLIDDPSQTYTRSGGRSVTDINYLVFKMLLQWDTDADTVI